MPPSAAQNQFDYSISIDLAKHIFIFQTIDDENRNKKKQMTFFNHLKRQLLKIEVMITCVILGYSWCQIQASYLLFLLYYDFCHFIQVRHVEIAYPF